MRHEPRDTTPIDTGGWKREPTPPEQRTTAPAPREPLIVDPKVIPWQGRVNGSREITLEMPGVPGMVDIPRNFRKKVGVVEPPSPSNGWRRAVLRVFGNGEVSLVVRWWPHRLSQASRQEIVNLTRLK